MREIRFERFRINLNTFTLYEADRRIPIGPKPLNTLLFLIENHGQYVSKESLRRHIWKSERIGASTVAMCIREIRSALSDDPNSPRFVETRNGKGYRFVPEVEALSDGSHNTPIDEFPFIGRDSAIEAIQKMLQQTRSSLRGQFACIIGEAGIGKTRLTRELADRYSHLAEIVYAAAPPDSPSFPFSIWRQSLAQLTLRQEIPEGQFRLISYVTTPSAESPSSSTTSSSLDHIINRSSFFDEWSALFRSACIKKPIALILEDLHYADEDSLMLLRHIASESTTMPLTIIATCRPSINQHDSSKRTEQQRLSGLGETIPLPAFTLEETRSLLTLCTAPQPNIASEVFGITSGNPFYTTQIIRFLRDLPPEEQSRSLSAALENSSSNVVARQLNDLPAHTREALAVASVIGTRFSQQLLAEVLKIEEGDAYDRLDPARVAQVIKEDHREFVFRHAILRDCLYNTLTPSDRQSRHAAVAQSLSQLNPRAHELEIFEHQHRGHPAVPAADVCATGLMAGISLISRFAYHEAMRVLTLAREIASRRLPAECDTRFAILIALADAALYTGNRHLHRSALDEAADLARSSHSGPKLAQVGLAMAPDHLSIEVGTYDIEAVMRLNESLTLTSATEGSVRSRVLARLSQFARWGRTDHGETERMSTEALSIARETGDLIAITSALEAYADAIYGPDRTDERISVIEELRSLTISRPDRFSFLLHQTRLIAALLERGDIRQVSIENNSYRRRATELGLPQYLWYPLSTDSMLACLSGDFDRAGQLAEEYRRIAGPNADENLRQTYACQFALRQIEIDATDSIVDKIEEFCRTQPSVLSWPAALTWCHWDSGKTEAARESFRQFSSSDIRRLFREPGGTIGIAALSEVAAYVASRSRAGELLELLTPVAARCATAGLGVAYFGSLARYAGLLAISTRDFSLARKLIRAAVTFEARIGARSWEIYSRLDFIRAVQERLEIDSNGALPGLSRIVKMPRSLLPRANRLLTNAISTLRIRGPEFAALPST